MVACCIHGEGVQRLEKLNKGTKKVREAKGN